MRQLRTKGFFDGVAAGSEEEKARMALARTRFNERMAATDGSAAIPRRHLAAAALHAPVAAQAASPATASPPAVLPMADRLELLERGAELVGRWASTHGGAPSDVPPPLPAADAADGLREAVSLLDRVLDTPISSSGGGSGGAASSANSTGGSSADALAPKERARALLLRATAHLELAHVPAACADAAAACAAAPHGSALWMRSHVKLGHALERAGDPRRAASDGYAPALEQDPANAVVRRYRDAAVARANARAQTGQSAGGAAGVDAHEGALGADEDSGDMHNMMGDPEVMQLANSMASQLLADPAMLAQVAALFPGGIPEGGSVDAAQLAALASRLDAAAPRTVSGTGGGATAAEISRVDEVD